MRGAKKHCWGDGGGAAVTVPALQLAGAKQETTAESTAPCSTSKAEIMGAVAALFDILWRSWEYPPRSPTLRK